MLQREVEGGADLLLMAFGQLSSHLQRAISAAECFQLLRSCSNRCGASYRTVVGFPCNQIETRPALASLGWQKSLKAETSAG